MMSVFCCKDVLLYRLCKLDLKFKSADKLLKSRGPILGVTSSETHSVCVKQVLAKFEYSSLIGQCRSLHWSRDTFLKKLRLYLYKTPLSHCPQLIWKYSAGHEFERLIRVNMRIWFMFSSRCVATYGSGAGDDVNIDVHTLRLDEIHYGLIYYYIPILHTGEYVKVSWTYLYFVCS